MPRTTSAAGRTWHFTHALGRYSNEHEGKTGGYTCPVDVAIGPDGNLFVLSRGYGYPPEVGLPAYPTRVGKTSIREDHFGDFARADFTMAAGIAVSNDSKVYCSDEAENLIKIYPSDVIYPPQTVNGDHERIDTWGETGSDDGQLDGPSGLAFDTNNDIYVVDSRNDRVQKFTKDGRFLLGWGSAGAGVGQFKTPWGITVAGDGSIYVADWGNDRIQKFTAEGHHLMSFGSSSDGAGLSRPSDVAVDSDGDVYATDWGHKRVQTFEPDGTPIAALYGDANHPTDSKAGAYNINRNPDVPKQYDMVEDLRPLGRFGRPMAVVVNRNNQVIVVDSRGRLQVYAKDNSYAEPDVKNEL